MTSSISVTATSAPPRRLGRSAGALALGFVAVIFGSANVFGGFMVTDRMLQMFKKKKK